MKTGDIVLVFWPFTNLTETKRRPALVLHVNQHNDFLLLFLTSREPEQELQLNYSIPPDSENNLKIISYARIDKLIVLNKDNCSGVIGTVSAIDFQQIKEKLSAFFKQLQYQK